MDQLVLVSSVRNDPAVKAFTTIQEQAQWDVAKKNIANQPVSEGETKCLERKIDEQPMVDTEVLEASHAKNGSCDMDKGGGSTSAPREMTGAKTSECVSPSTNCWRHGRPGLISFSSR